MRKDQIDGQEHEQGSSGDPERWKGDVEPIEQTVSKKSKDQQDETCNQHPAQGKTSPFRGRTPAVSTAKTAAISTGPIVTNRSTKAEAAVSNIA